MNEDMFRDGENIGVQHYTKFVSLQGGLVCFVHCVQRKLNYYDSKKHNLFCHH